MIRTAVQPSLVKLARQLQILLVARQVLGADLPSHHVELREVGIFQYALFDKVQSVIVVLILALQKCRLHVNSG